MAISFRLGLVVGGASAGCWVWASAGGGWAIYTAAVCFSLCALCFAIAEVGRG